MKIKYINLEHGGIPAKMKVVEWSMKAKENFSKTDKVVYLLSGVVNRKYRYLKRDIQLGLTDKMIYITEFYIHL